ncbi:helix-turn-helix transcriptional regulator [Variovorax sp. tm]|uniref:helix-turn-helix transcriptional regulator n=1 Tax=Variovorax atrisoli TaxID=3394203 RepID=UPI003A803EA4
MKDPWPAKRPVCLAASSSIASAIIAFATIKVHEHLDFPSCQSAFHAEACSRRGRREARRLHARLDHPRSNPHPVRPPEGNAMLSAREREVLRLVATGHVAEEIALQLTISVEALERCNARFARWWWHWFFYAQPEKPERAILADTEAWYGGSPKHRGAEAFEDFRQAIHDPDTVHAMVEDYRAGLGITWQRRTRGTRDAPAEMSSALILLLGMPAKTFGKANENFACRPTPEPPFAEVVTIRNNRSKKRDCLEETRPANHRAGANHLRVPHPSGPGLRSGALP